MWFIFAVNRRQFIRPEVRVYAFYGSSPKSVMVKGSALNPSNGEDGQPLGGFQPIARQPSARLGGLSRQGRQARRSTAGNARYVFQQAVSTAFSQTALAPDALQSLICCWLRSYRAVKAESAKAVETASQELWDARNRP